MECNEALNCLEYLGSLISVELDGTHAKSKSQGMLETVFRKTVLKKVLEIATKKPRANLGSRHTLLELFSESSRRNDLNSHISKIAGST